MSATAYAEGYVQAIPPQYDGAYSFSEGLAAVLIGEEWGFIDDTGKVVLPPKYDEVAGYGEGAGFHEGLAGVSLGGKWGVIDKTGKEVVPPKYDYLEVFHDGLAGVMLYDEQDESMSHAGLDFSSGK